MNHEEYKQAANYWIEIDKKGPHVEREVLLQRMERYIKENDTCALATAYNGNVRCTPIEYVYHEGNFYIFTEGGEKFANLEHNKNVSLAIFDKFQGFHKLHSVQVFGIAEIIDRKTDKYSEIAAVKGLKPERLEAMNHILHLIKIRPTEMNYIDSTLKQEEMSIRQKITL